MPRRPTPAALAERAQLATVLQTAIGRLRPEYREVVTLRYERELDYDEIAEITGLPMGTVKSSLHRARKELAEHLENLGWSATTHSTIVSDERLLELFRGVDAPCAVARLRASDDAGRHARSGAGRPQGASRSADVACSGGRPSSLRSRFRCWRWR